ncbi:hypothetical protein SALBM135S_08151 [Streptomyces alboniger]
MPAAGAPFAAARPVPPVAAFSVAPVIPVTVAPTVPMPTPQSTRTAATPRPDRTAAERLPRRFTPWWRGPWPPAGPSPRLRAAAVPEGSCPGIGLGLNAL